MKIIEAKEEVIKRYDYLSKNAGLILAPYICIENGSIKLKDEGIFLNKLIEEFLLSDKCVEESKLYQIIESNKNSKKYLEQVKLGITKIKEYNDTKAKITRRINLNINTILDIVYDYIRNKDKNSSNKKMELNGINKYYMLNSYYNKGRILLGNKWIYIGDLDTREQIVEETNENNLTGENDFLHTLNKYSQFNFNLSNLTEEEREQILLLFQNRIPNNLKMECRLEEQDLRAPFDTRLERPEYTEPCGLCFDVDEERIFTDSCSNGKYYQICPYCGFMVYIPQELLSDKVKQRIINRCKQEDKAFLKKYLYSELYSLENKEPNNQRRLIKN